VEYVESQEGRNFSSKLINLLAETQSGEERRRATISEYDRLISERTAKLNELSKNTCNAVLLSRKLDQFYRSIGGIVE
jgi:hypothetical protein